MMREQLKGILIQVLQITEETAEGLKEDSDLVELGLDSLKAIELVVYLEDTFGIMISDDDLLLDNMSTITKIEKMVSAYQ